MFFTLGTLSSVAEQMALKKKLFTDSAIVSGRIDGNR